MKKKKDGSLELVQPFLIERILILLGMNEDTVHNSKSTPAIRPFLNRT